MTCITGQFQASVSPLINTSIGSIYIDYVPAFPTVEICIEDSNFKYLPLGLIVQGCLLLISTGEFGNISSMASTLLLTVDTVTSEGHYYTFTCMAPTLVNIGPEITNATVSLSVFTPPAGGGSVPPFVITSPTNGQFLQYNSTEMAFTNQSENQIGFSGYLQAPVQSGIAVNATPTVLPYPAVPIYGYLLNSFTLTNNGSNQILTYTGANTVDVIMTLYIEMLLQESSIGALSYDFQVNQNSSSLYENQCEMAFLGDGYINSATLTAAFTLQNGDELTFLHYVSAGTAAVGFKHININITQITYP